MVTDAFKTSRSKNIALTFSKEPKSGLCHVSILIMKSSFMYSFWEKERVMFTFMKQGFITNRKNDFTLLTFGTCNAQTSDLRSLLSSKPHVFKLAVILKGKYSYKTGSKLDVVQDLSNLWFIYGGSCGNWSQKTTTTQVWFYDKATDTVFKIEVFRHSQRNMFVDNIYYTCAHSSY